MYLCHWSSSQRKESAMWVSPKAQGFLLFIQPGRDGLFVCFSWLLKIQGLFLFSSPHEVSGSVRNSRTIVLPLCVCVTEGTAVSTSVFSSGLLLFWNLVSYNAHTGGLNPRGWRGGYLVMAWNAMPQNWLCGIPDPTLGFSGFFCEGVVLGCFVFSLCLSDIADVFWLSVFKYEGHSLECHVKLASSCVVASVMLDLSSGHCQDWKAALRKSILVSY